MIKIFVSWSGGKDASFSFYKAAQNRDVEIAYFLNMISENGECSRTHGISSELMRLQAQAIGVSIVQRKTTWETYEKEFKKALLGFKKEGVQSGVFGDIDIQAHRDWVERVCGECGIKPLFPLWQRERGGILREFIHSGFEAVVVAVNADILSSTWVGRRIDEKFVKELGKMSNIDLCGETGEYHTFVFDGPIFKKKIKILETKKIHKDKSWVLDIINYEISN